MAITALSINHLSPDELLTLCKKTDKQLTKGYITYQDIILTYGNEENKRQNQLFLTSFAQSLQDPSYDFKRLAEIVEKKWQVKALAKGMASNELVKTMWTEGLVQQIFKELNNKQEKTEIQLAFAKAEDIIKNSIKKQEKVKQAFVIDLYIKPTRYQELKKNIYTSKNILSWEILIKIMNAGAGIRHVSSLKQAEYEMENGVKGDGLGIAHGLGCFIYHMITQGQFSGKSLESYFESQVVNQIIKLKGEGYNSEPLIYKLIFKNLSKAFSLFSNEEKNHLLKVYEETLRQFIYESCLMDNPIPKEAKNWKETWESRLTESSTFIVIQKKECVILYDQDLYYNLGKFGKGRLSQTDLKSFTQPISKKEILNAQKDVQDVTDQVIAIQEWMVDRYLSQIIKFIQELG